MGRSVLCLLLLAALAGLAAGLAAGGDALDTSSGQHRRLLNSRPAGMNMPILGDDGLSGRTSSSSSGWGRSYQPPRSYQQPMSRGWGSRGLLQNRRGRDRRGDDEEQEQGDSSMAPAPAPVMAPEPEPSARPAPQPQQQAEPEQQPQQQEQPQGQPMARPAGLGGGNRGDRPQPWSSWTRPAERPLQGGGNWGGMPQGGWGQNSWSQGRPQPGMLGPDNQGGQGQGQGQGNTQGQGSSIVPQTRPSPGGQGQGSSQGRGNGRGDDRGEQAFNRWRNSVRNNRQSLSGVSGNVDGYRSIRRQSIPVSSRAAPLAQGVRRRGNARSAAQSLAQAYSQGQGQAAAEALASAATATGPTVGGAGQSSEAVAVAEAVAETAVAHPSVAPALLAKSANLAVERGQTDRYAATMADAFVVAKRKRSMPQFTTAVADAISTGGAPARYAYGEAIATAIAAGGDSQAAIAEATATAICTGGSTASAWSEAYAVALSRDSRGCLVLNQARAMARAQCGSGASQSIARAQAASTVLGFCGLLDFFPGLSNFSWAGGNSGSNTSGWGGQAGGSAWGRAGGS